MIPSRKSKAVGLFSGGLDSILATKLITEQGVTVVALHYRLPFGVPGREPTEEKLSTYESGMEPVKTARERFSVKFYLVAMLFIVFDIEVVFMYPWAVVYRQLGVFGFVEMILFIGVLLIGLLYIVRKGALRWQ